MQPVLSAAASAAAPTPVAYFSAPSEQERCNALSDKLMERYTFNHSTVRISKKDKALSLSDRLVSKMRNRSRQDFDSLLVQDAWDKVFSFLKFEDKLKFRKVCKGACKVVGKSLVFWRQLEYRVLQTNVPQPLVALLGGIDRVNALPKANSDKEVTQPLTLIMDQFGRMSLNFRCLDLTTKEIKDLTVFEEYPGSPWKFSFFNMCFLDKKEETILANEALLIQRCLEKLDKLIKGEQVSSHLNPSEGSMRFELIK